jgi:hypothetical protein
MTKMSNKAVMIWCAIILVFQLITLYYGGVDAIVSGAMSLFAIALAYICWKEMKKE